MTRSRLILWFITWSLGAVAFGALPPPPSFTLPAGVIPRKHIIELTIDPARETFEGLVRIEVDLRKSTTVFWVNAKDLTPLEASVEAGGQTQPAIAEIVGGEFLALEVRSPVRSGRATLSIRFQGRLDTKATGGPYRRRVENEWYVFTTFTPIEARRAFPCFDEPRFKTPWELTVRVKHGDKAFANAPEVRETEGPDGMTAVQFAPTHPLPAELVAFAVGPFDVLEGAPVGHGTPVRVITPKGHAEDGRSALDATDVVLPRLEAYTSIPYKFGKLDHIAVPDGEYAAVENPGLITYLTRELLVAPGAETPQNARSIRALEAHELSHQWFGDLVTQANWDDVWLSEGFATWLSAKIMDQELPPARKNLSAVVARERIMISDASPKTRPVRVAVNSRTGSRDIYNRMVYQKGAAVLLMLEGWLGEDRLKTGLRAYLTKHQFQNADTADLASALRDAGGGDPTAVMRSFLDRTGVPAISAEVRCPTGAAPRVEIAQTGSGNAAIPVCWRTGETAAATCSVLDSPHREIVLEHAACPSWVYWNAGGTGYYRTAWAEAQLTSLADRGLSELTPAERLTLVYDLRALKPGRRPEVLELLNKLSTDPELEIAKAAGDALPAKPSK